MKLNSLGIVLIVVAGGSMTGCGSGESAAPPLVSTNEVSAAGTTANGTVNACDGIRHQIRNQAVKEFGLDQMMDQMKTVSHEITAEQREDLHRFTTAVDSMGIDPMLRSQSTKSIQSIYSDAITRSGLKLGEGEKHEDIQRFVTPFPSGFDPLFDGFTPVFNSTLVTPSTGAPVVGTVTDAYLAVNAAQNRYEFIFMQIKSVSPGPNNGYSSTGEYITMSQYVDTLMPKYCSQVGTALTPTDVNQMAIAPAAATTTSTSSTTSPAAAAPSTAATSLAAPAKR